MSCRLEAVAAAAANEATNVVARPNLGDVPSIRVQLSSLQARTQPSRGAAAVAVAVVDVGSPRVGRVESLASLRNESLAPLSLMLSTSATVTLLLSLCSWLPPHSVRPTFRLSLFLRLLSSVCRPPPTMNMFLLYQLSSRMSTCGLAKSSGERASRFPRRPSQRAAPMRRPILLRPPRTKIYSSPAILELSSGARTHTRFDYDYDGERESNRT